jgi:hypothetical protein
VGLLDGLLRRQQPPQVRSRGDDRLAADRGTAPAVMPGAPPRATARELQEQEWRHEIARHEWIVLHVPAGENGSPPYQYTAGLTERGLPEMVVYGLRLKTGMLVLDDLASRLLDGVEYPDGADVPGLLPDVPGTQLWDVTWLQDPLDAAFRLYGTRIPLRQLVVPDGQARLPWDVAYESPHLQPVLFVPPNRLGPRPAVLPQGGVPFESLHRGGPPGL